MNKNNKILVTGGSGFIGRSLVIRLISAGYYPVVFDNNFRGTDKNFKGVINKLKIYKGDIRDITQLKEAAHNCSTIIHLAFINGTKFFYENPDLVLDVGIKGAINTLEIAKALDVKKYILASSSEVYQQPDVIPTPENEKISIPDITNPRYSYAGGKILSELMTINYLRNTKIEHSIFRPHNVFGPQMGFEHVIPELVKKIFISTNSFTNNECDIEIQGTGQETRAFCFVEDAVDQIILILSKGKNGEIYHVGIDEEITIIQLISDISAILNIKINTVKGPVRKGGTKRRCPKINKICSLGYKKNNRYHLGLQKTVEWYKKYYLNQI